MQNEIRFDEQLRTDGCPLCFDCELIERKTRSDDLKKTEEQLSNEQSIHENNQSDQINSDSSEAEILSTVDEFEDYTNSLMPIFFIGLMIFSGTR